MWMLIGFIALVLMFVGFVALVSAVLPSVRRKHPQRVKRSGIALVVGFVAVVVAALLDPEPPPQTQATYGDRSPVPAAARPEHPPPNVAKSTDAISAPRATQPAPASPPRTSRASWRGVELGFSRSDAIKAIPPDFEKIVEREYCSRQSDYHSISLLSDQGAMADLPLDETAQITTCMTNVRHYERLSLKDDAKGASHVAMLFLDGVLFQIRVDFFKGERYESVMTTMSEKYGKPDYEGQIALAQETNAGAVVVSRDKLRGTVWHVGDDLVVLQQDTSGLTYSDLKACYYAISMNPEVHAVVDAARKAAVARKAKEENERRQREKSKAQF